MSRFGDIDFVCFGIVVVKVESFYRRDNILSWVFKKEEVFFWL